MTTPKVLPAAIVMAAACAAPAVAGGVIIGHTNAAAVAGFSQAQMDSIAQFKWFFAHASVGGNMMNGIADLHASDTNFYKIAGASDDQTPPATTLAARIYDYSRGNPGWYAKMTQYVAYVTNGWRSPKVNLSMDKLCYIDQAADLGVYLSIMTNLEARYPETVFVYATIPLMTSEDSDNRLRNVYNINLRGWVFTNDRVLFDIADIEAHDTSGNAYTFTNTGLVCQKLFAGFTSDGGHLNTTGRQRVAAGYYALGSALLTVDRDGDGQTDGAELVAGTAPRSSNSLLSVNQAAAADGAGLVVSWPSASNRIYGVHRATNLCGSAPYAGLATNLAATPPLNTYTDAPAGAGPFFYRVGARQ